MTVTVTVYPQAKLDIMDKKIDFSSDAFKIALLDGASYNSANTVFADVSAHELAGANGYTSGGQALSGETVTASGANAEFTASTTTWTASGGSIGPTGQAIIYDTTYLNRLIAFIDFGGENTAGDGTPLKITWNASGILLLS